MDVSAISALLFKEKYKPKGEGDSSPTNADILEAVGKIKKGFAGIDDYGRTSTLNWISKFEESNFSQIKTFDALSGDAKQLLVKLNEEMLHKSYLVGDDISFVDCYIYALLHPLVASMSHKDRIQLNNVARYFDLVQNENISRTLGLTTVEIVRHIELPLEKPSQPQKGGASSKKNKKDAKKTKAQKKPQVKKVDRKSIPVASRIDLRVGLFKKVDLHPDADTLFISQVDVGEEKPRTILSGLVHFMTPESLVGTQGVFICNLKNRKMVGVESQGMVLAASDANHEKVELVRPPAGCKPGDHVLVEGFERDVDAQLPPKHKVFEQFAESLRTDGEGFPKYKDSHLVTKEGKTTCPLANCEIH